MTETYKTDVNPPRHPLFFDLLHLIEKQIERVSLVPATPFIPQDYFPWAAELEAETSSIEQEFQKLIESNEPLPAFQEISPEQANITQDQKWRTFVLYAYGAKSIRNTNLCPRTTRAIEKIPGLKTAFFSILDAGKTIPAHRGPYKGLLRAHLGIRIPNGNCGIRVGNETSTWQQGKLLFFDDTLQHEAWNLSQQQRVVLFLDILRPLRAPYHSWNEQVIRWIAKSPFGAKSVRIFRDWYARHGITNDAVIEPHR